MTDADGAGAAATAALVGATGGAGVTRLAVELGATLARDGRRVAVFDAAFGTQGLGDYVEGRVDADVTDLVTDDDAVPAAAMTELPTAAPGELHLAPARAGFGDLARAKTPAAARRLETAIAEAGAAFDHVLVDVPPPASNPAVSAVTAADRVGLVAPPSPRGADAVGRIRDRIADVGGETDLLAVNRGESEALAPDVTVPEGPPRAAAPACDDGSGEFPAAVADLAAGLFGVELDLDFEEESLFGL